ncbi:unnamed protein product [Caenorhabditis auriculariae]|uniref:Uncharacterized protein n=1 Tax=Caenorhabditis auriculariae TaxID=2777116 RepID=A0A8S1HFT9_9PELO|nr:unnamed protein product [Caenorhabditis auriculariae]
MYNWSTGLCETVRNSPVDDVCWRCRGVAILLMRIGSTAAMKILKVVLSGEWEKIPMSVIDTLMDSMPRRCQAVMSSRGCATKY